MRRENPKILNDFLNFLLLIQNYSKETIKSYNSDLLIFLKFIIKYLGLKIKISDINIFILASIKRSDIIAFMVYLNYERDNCFRSRQRKMASLKSFYKWIFNNYPSITKYKENPMINIPAIKPTERLPKFLSLEKVKRISNIFNISNSRNAIRDNAIITLFLNCGLRLSELSGINICNINFNKRTINVIGKRNKERIVYLNKKTIISIKNYLDTKEIIDYKGPLFTYGQNKRLSIYSIEKICHNAFKLADLSDYGYTSHSLRHTAAVNIYRHTKDILILRDFLGHESVKSSEVYIHVDNDAVRNAVNSNPLNNYIPGNVEIEKKAA